MSRSSARIHRMALLRNAFEEAGLFNSKYKVAFTNKIRRLEERGRLQVKRNPMTGHRVFSKEDVEAIVNAFLPGGNGCWYYKQQELTKTDQRLLMQEKDVKEGAMPDLADIIFKE